MERDPIYYSLHFNFSSPPVQAGAMRVRLGEERWGLDTVAGRERVGRLTGKDIFASCGGKHHLRLIFTIPTTRPAWWWDGGGGRRHVHTYIRDRLVSPLLFLLVATIDLDSSSTVIVQELTLGLVLTTCEACEHCNSPPPRHIHMRWHDR